ncbi:MAG: PEGA domain-containing protein, partial [Thermoanaerobaculia bacterium]
MNLALLLAMMAGGPAASTATLLVESQPAVEVVWEGVPLGVTGPDGTLTIADIPPGSYAVTLRKEGHRPSERRIELGPGPARLAQRLAPWGESVDRLAAVPAPTAAAVERVEETAPREPTSPPVAAAVPEPAGAPAPAALARAAPMPRTSGSAETPPRDGSTGPD